MHDNVSYDLYMAVDLYAVEYYTGFPLNFLIFCSASAAKKH